MSIEKIFKHQSGKIGSKEWYGHHNKEFKTVLLETVRDYIYFNGKKLFNWEIIDNCSVCGTEYVKHKTKGKHLRRCEECKKFRNGTLEWARRMFKESNEIRIKPIIKKEFKKVRFTINKEKYLNSSAYEKYKVIRG